MFRAENALNIDEERSIFRAENALNSQSSLGANAKNCTETVQVAAQLNQQKKAGMSRPASPSPGHLHVICAAVLFDGVTVTCRVLRR